VTELATCSPGVATDVGLTTKLGPLRAADELATGGAEAEGGVGRGVFTVIPGNSMGGETEIWPNAVEEQIAQPTELKMLAAADVRTNADCSEARKRERMKTSGSDASGTSPRTKSPQSDVDWFGCCLHPPADMLACDHG
jgi:hypothetical protein